MHQEYLQKMDITLWELRDQQSVSDVVFCRLNNASGKSVGLIVANILQKNEEELLQKIARALTPHFVIENDAPQENNFQFVILLGASAKKHAILCERIIYSYSLSDLIENAAHKKTLWNEIKSVRALIQEFPVNKKFSSFDDLER